MVDSAEVNAFWWEWYHYIYGGFAAFLYICLLFLLILRNRRSERDPTGSLQSFHQDLLTWKAAILKMREYYKVMDSVSKQKFYLGRFMGLILFAWLVTFCYRVNFFHHYLNYLTYIYVVMFVLENFFLFYVVHQQIYPNFNNISHDKTAILIPFGGHKLEEKFETLHKVLSSACKIADSKAIFLLHNGADLEPQLYGEIRAIAEIHKVNYVYVPMPNKSFCVFYCAKYLCEKFSQCLIIDDDVILHDQFRVPNLGTLDVAGYPISAHKNDDDNCWSSFLVDMQNLEYGMSSMVKVIQARWSTGSSALSHHGAIGLWKKDKLVEVMSYHDSVFHGEDLMMGVIAYRLGYKMKMVEDMFVPTETPKKIFGWGGLWNQRIKSWDYIVLKYVSVYIKLLLHGSIFGNIILKFFIFIELWTIFIDVQRLFVLGYALYTNTIMVAIFIAGVAGFNMLLNIRFNYSLLTSFGRPSSLFSIFVYPLYKFFLVILRNIGELMYLFKYTSGYHRMTVLIKDMPELPNVLEETVLKLEQIDWTKIWSNEDYMRYTMSFTRPYSRTLIRKEFAKLRAEAGAGSGSSDSNPMSGGGKSQYADASNFSVTRPSNEHIESSHKVFKHIEKLEASRSRVKGSPLGGSRRSNRSRNYSRASSPSRSPATSRKEAGDLVYNPIPSVSKAKSTRIFPTSDQEHAERSGKYHNMGGSLSFNRLPTVTESNSSYGALSGAYDNNAGSIHMVDLEKGKKRHPMDITTETETDAGSLANKRDSSSHPSHKRDSSSHPSHKRDSSSHPSHKRDSMITQAGGKIKNYLDLMELGDMIPPSSDMSMTKETDKSAEDSGITLKPNSPRPPPDPRDRTLRRERMGSNPPNVVKPTTLEMEDFSQSLSDAREKSKSSPRNTKGSEIKLKNEKKPQKGSSPEKNLIL